MNKETPFGPLSSLSPREVLQNTLAAIKDLEEEGNNSSEMQFPNVRGYRKAMQLKAEIIAQLPYSLDDALNTSKETFPKSAIREIDILSLQAEDALVTGKSFDQHILLHSFGEKPGDPNDLEKIIYSIYPEKPNK